MRLNPDYLSRILSTPATATSAGHINKARTPRALGLTPRGSTSTTTPRASITSSGPAPGTGVLLISNAHERKQLSYYHLLYTEMGFKNCQKFFFDHSILAGERTQRHTFVGPDERGKTGNASPHTPKSPKEKEGCEEQAQAEAAQEQESRESRMSSSCKSSLAMRAVSETQFINFMRELAPDMGDHQIVVAFDVFDKEDCGGIFFDEWFLILALYCAIESGEALQFLYRHSEHMFRALLDDPSAEKMVWGEFTRLAYLMGIHERELFKMLEPFKVDIFDPISYDDFVLFYFEVFSGMNQQVESAHLSGSSRVRTGMGNPMSASRDLGPKKEGDCCVQ